MSATAFQEPYVHLNPTFGALLAPQSLLWRLDLHFFFLCGTVLRVAGLVGPLERTLRVDAVARIGSLTTDRTKFLQRRRNDGDRFENAHEGSER